MSSLGTVLLIIVVAVVMALGGLLLVRRIVPSVRFAQHTDVAGYVYAVIGVLYAVILAQVVIAAWEEYRDARNVATAEAAAVLNLARMAQGWPEAGRDQVETALAAYAQHVVDVEWPAMARGDFTPAADTAYVHQIWGAIDEAAKGAHPNDSPRFSAALDQLDALDAARGSRALLGAEGLPTAMTLTLLAGAVVTVGFSYLFAVESGWAHGLMTASLAMLVGLLLLLQFQLESPFSGVVAIEPKAMESVLAEINSEALMDQAAP